MALPTEKQMRSAIAKRDKNQDGSFFYGVVTTGVFCQPSCSSRAAKPENLRFFPTAETAVSAGFRPCKRCTPIADNPKLNQLIEIARFIEKHADERMTLNDLALKANLSPSRLQRVFKNTFGISPKAYQDSFRMQQFKDSLKSGDSVTNSIFSSGFGSVSRVYGEMTRSIGMAPKSYRAGGAGEEIFYACRKTCLGYTLMAATQRGVCFVQFDDNKETLFELLKKEFPNATLAASSEAGGVLLDTWIEALNQHMEKGLPRPDIPLDIRGTAFQIKVWKFLISIPEGDILSYTELAESIDKPRAVRATASACAKNRIGVLIPCHRVLRGDGSLGGYRWGLERKRALLDLEKTHNPKSR